MQQSSGLTLPYCADASRGGLLLRNILCFYSQQDQWCNVRRTCVSGETSNGSQTDASISRNFDFAEIQTAVGLLIKTEIMSEKGNPCSRCGPTEAEDQRSDPRCLWDDSKHFSQSTVRLQSDEMRSVRGKSKVTAIASIETCLTVLLRNATVFTAQGSWLVSMRRCLVL